MAAYSCDTLQTVPPAGERSSTRSVSFKTLGCRLNQAETGTLRGRFRAAGYSFAPFGSPCDLAVINTCAVTADAERASWQAARSFRRRYPDALLILTGCATRLPVNRMPAGDDPRTRVARRHRDVLKSAGVPPSAPVPSIPHFSTTRALVKVQDGCGFRCAYCVVPLVRGRPRSRPIARVVGEVERLAAQGHREVVLTGANLGTYRDGARRLVHLLQRLESISGLDRIRLSSLEVTTAEREILSYMRTSRRVCRYLHVPLQSGSDGVLRAMRRRYTTRDFRAFVDEALRQIPLLGVGTDIIAGFPGEDPSRFEETLAFLLSLPLAKIHVFPYSARPGTSASNLPDRPSASDVARRLRVLRDLSDEKTAAFARQFIGRSVEVLIEGLSADGSAQGWTSEYLRARVRNGSPGAQTPGAGRPETNDGAACRRAAPARNTLVTFIPTRYDGSALS